MERAQLLVRETPRVPYRAVGEVTSVTVRRLPCDGVFATAVLSPKRILAVFYWARYIHHGTPLVLCDYEVGPLSGNSWAHVGERLVYWAAERKSRLPRPAGLFVETEMLAQQATAAGVTAKPIPPWLLVPDAWSQVLQSAAGILTRDEVGYTQLAYDRMDQRPFLTEAGVLAGPRTEDPTAPAFLFGVVLALDEASARNPKPKPPQRSART